MMKFIRLFVLIGVLFLPSCQIDGTDAGFNLNEVTNAWPCKRLYGDGTGDHLVYEITNDAIKGPGCTQIFKNIVVTDRSDFPSAGILWNQIWASRKKGVYYLAQGINHDGLIALYQYKKVSPRKFVSCNKLVAVLKCGNK